jgi:uncharacterized protein (TIGR03084 family)
MPADVAALLADLNAETAALWEILDPLRDSDWLLETPAPGWNIGDQVAHLAYFDDVAVAAATRPEEFAAMRAGLDDGGENPDTIAARYRNLTPAEIRDWFARARAGLLTAFASLDPSARVPWFGPPMSVASSVTARLMETWAHGQDIADTIGTAREPTARLRHIAHIGVAALPYSYAANGLSVPDVPVRVELTAPSGEVWTWGSDAARDRIAGPALDFCLLVTRRRHRADTAMVAAGPVADQWLSIAQSFAGPPGAGRQPGQFAR